MTTSDAEARFLKYVKKTKSCWLWTGSNSGGKRNRYGKFTFDNRNVSAHRMSMYFWRGFDLGDSLSIHHTCSNTLCVNPDHLRTVTSLDNMIEMLERKHYVAAIARLNAEVKRLNKEVACLKRNSKGPATNRG